MKMLPAISPVLVLLLAGGCATTTSEWAVSDTGEPNILVLQAQPDGNRAKAQRTALVACQSKGYGRALAVDGPEASCSSTAAAGCAVEQVTATFACAEYMSTGSDMPVAFTP